MPKTNAQTRQVIPLFCDPAAPCDACRLAASGVTAGKCLADNARAKRRQLIPVIAVLAFAAGCATEDELPAPPTCEELGAAPDEPLFCTAEGVCAYAGEKCTRQPEAE